MQIQQSAPVVVRFQIEDYSDALHFVDQADRDQYSNEQIEAMCQARFDNWKAVISAPRPEPTPEEIQAQIDALVGQQRVTQDQILSLAAPEVAVPILEEQQNIIASQLAELTGV